MSKCILLSRVSTFIQTLEQQTNELIVEAKKMGYTDSQLIVIENHESAIKLDESERIGIQKMYNAIESDKSIDCVICYEVSRLSRRLKDLYSIRDFLIEHNVQLIILKPYLRLLDPDGKMSQGANLMFSLFASMSESEMMIKKERMMRGKRQKIKECKYAGGNIAIGYTYDKKTGNILVDDNATKVIRQIFDMCENGDSTYTIAKYMFEKGLIEGKTIENVIAKVGQILRNIAYTGNAETGYPYPQIISNEQFDKCKEIRTKHRKLYTKTKYVYFGKGILYNRRNMRALTPGAASNIYNSYDYSTRESISINLNFIDSVIWAVVKEHIYNDNPERRIKYIRAKYDALEVKIRRNNSKIDDYSKREERIERRIIEGKLNESRGDIMLDEIYNAKSVILDELDKLHSEETDLMNEMIYANSFLSTNGNKYETTDDEERKEIILAEIDKVLLEKTDKFGVHECEIIFKDGSKKILTLKCANRYQKVIDKNGNEFKFENLKRFSKKIYGADKQK